MQVVEIRKENGKNLVIIKSSPWDKEAIVTYEVGDVLLDDSVFKDFINNYAKKPFIKTITNILKHFEKAENVNETHFIIGWLKGLLELTNHKDLFEIVREIEESLNKIEVAIREYRKGE